MKTDKRPVWATVGLGLLFGIAYIPMGMTFGYFVGGSLAFRMTAVAFILVYACFLAHWGKTRLGSVMFPLAILTACAFWIRSGNDFLLLTLATLAWIRSGICFRGPLLRSVGMELLLCFGGGALVSLFAPHSRVAWALGIWMFFLIQSLYFVFLMERSAEKGGGVPSDPFEAARRQAERILSTSFKG
jgi:hypothetical protein